MRTTGKSGFTLVEVMAAVAIFGIAMTAVYATFDFQQKSYSTQSRVAETQANLRAALETISRDLRMAGYGIPAPVTIPDNVIAAGVTSIRSLYPVNSTGAPDSLHMIYLYDMDQNQPPTTITSSMPNASAEFNVAAVTGFQDGDMVIITNGTNSSFGTAADMFHVTQVQSGSLKLQHNPGGAARDYNAPGGHNTFPPSGYGTGSTLAKARFLRYFVDSADPDRPMLMVDRMGSAAAQPVADFVEDMQLTYGLDTNSDGIVDSWVAAPTSAQIAQIRQARIELCGRTQFPEKGWQGNRPALGDRGAGGSDGYRRRILSTVIDVPNSGVN